MTSIVPYEIPAIDRLDALEILDSRGLPTVEVRCVLAGGERGEASVPAGASTGRAEAHELRDGDPDRYRGYGCRRAVSRVRGEISDHLSGRSFEDHRELDAALRTLDGTDDCSRLGANAVLGVSLAVARAAARAADRDGRCSPKSAALVEYLGGLAPSRGRDPEGGSDPADASTLPPEPRLPRPWINLLSGGLHAGRQVGVQDVMVVPAGSGELGVLLEAAFRCRESAAELITDRYGGRRLTADEGGWAPPVESSRAMIELAVESIEEAGMRPGEDVAIALDVAASHFAEGGDYRMDGSLLTAEAMIDRLVRWAEAFPIASLEDGLAEEDWTHWTELRERLAPDVRVIGDDLLCTDPERVDRAIREQAADTLLLKVNQAGTLSRAAEAAARARSAEWQFTASARSGETEDHWLADLAVAWRADHIKVGSLAQSERLAKYNRLLELERRLELQVAPL